ncbi:MAG: non-canonical purine NTP pyrophosphatase [Chloroflexi bacterium]|nr:non-canonical purine NTP pyrophosphatase [Chloroflexota bacterium]MDA1270933.1 non-canonical purine NTP pyrophosphatase [Chloroflexota bacterium]PKB59718.1 MAG: non-canonical purine NTP pyrophosphatase [SAR202 cluster bacterium Casp-Chloro-G2]
MAYAQPAHLLIATGNPGKMREYADLLSGLPFQLVSLRDLGITHEVNETGDTFEENAWLKASEYAAISGLLTLADDSGLEVDALSGAPGVRSARYGGDACASDQDRVALLLKNLEGVPWEQRGARFRCVIAVARLSLDPDTAGGTKQDLSDGAASPFREGGREGDLDASPLETSTEPPALVAQTEGSVAGMIQYTPMGDDGFGYDPVFYLPAFDKTFAQLPLADKNKLSHRALAAQKAVELLRNLNPESR